MKKATLFFALMVLALLTACNTEKQANNDTVPRDNNKLETGFGGITKQQCIEAKGNWNECGSPCAGTDADFCIEVCQVQCECGGIDGFKCPSGYKCRLSGKIADEMGVCAPK